MKMELKKHPWKQCEFELYKDNEPTGKIYVLNDENNWCIEEWLDDEHEYDFREINIPRGYKPEYYRYRDDQVNNIMVRNGIQTWTINLICNFEDDNDSKGLRPTQLSFNLKYGENNQEVVLNNENENEWLFPIENISNFDFNDYQVEIKSNIQNTPQLLFYNHEVIEETKDEESFIITIGYKFTFNDNINRVVQNLMEFVLETYATKTELNDILSSGGTSNNNMRIRKIEREIKRLQKELDIIKSEK